MGIGKEAISRQLSAFSIQRVSAGGGKT